MVESIGLNMIPKGIAPMCYAAQYDAGRSIRVNLFSGITPYVLDGTETVTLNVRKPDNTIVTAELTNTSDNYVTFETTEQMCAVAGINKCTISVAKSGNTIASLNFFMSVQADVLSSGIPSESVIRDLDAQVVAAVGNNYYTKTETNEALNSKADKTTTNALQSSIQSQQIAIDLLTDPSSNLYNPINTLENKYIKTDGTLDYNANYNVTELYTLPAGKKIVMSAYLTSATPPYRTNANACRKTCIYKPDNTVEMLSSSATAYTYTNTSQDSVGVRFQLWGTGAERSVTDIYIVIVDADVTVPPTVYTPYGYKLADNIITSDPQTLTESQKSQVRVNIGASKSYDFTNEDFFTELANTTGISISTDQYTGLRVASISGNGSSHTWKKIKIPCVQAKTYILEFWGKTSDDSYYANASENGTLVVEFYDSSDNKIGNQKYNAYVLGKSRLAYHKYGFVSPLGSAYAQVRIVTRGNTNIQLANISFTQIERVMPRQDDGIILVGHQGMIYSAPKNTIPSFELGIVAGFNTNIINPNVTADGVLVCLHSDDISSVSNGTGKVYDYTYDELQELDFGSWYNAAYTGTKIPKLEEAVGLLAVSGQRIGVSFHGVSFNTHMTSAKVIEACELIKKYSYKKPLIKSFAPLDLTDAVTVFGDEATYVYCLDGSNLSTKIDNMSSFNHNLIIELASSDVTPELIAQAKGYGFGVSVYFGNEPTRMKELIKLGVNMFTVDTFSDVIIPMD